MNRFRKAKDDRVLRRLSPIETFQSAGHSLNIYVGCAVSCRYRIPNSFQTSGADLALEEKIEQAIAGSITQHPLFTAGRSNEGKKKQYWVRLDTIDLNNHVRWKNVSEGEDYATALNDAFLWEVNERYTKLETQPQWRVTAVVPATNDFVDVIFAWDHTVADGKSGRIFHDSLLACLNSDSDSVTLEHGSFKVPVTDFTPPLHQMIKFPISLNYAVSILGKELMTDKKAPAHTAKWAPIKLEPYESRLKSTTVGKDALKPVLDACRQHDTTLTGLLHALISVSMATRLSKERAPAFSTGTPICLRQFQKPGTSKFDLNKTAINGVVYWPYVFKSDIVTTLRKQINDAKEDREMNKPLEETLWSIAKSIREGLTTKLKLGTKNDSIGLAKFITDWNAYLMDHSTKREHSWEVSNLGVMDGQSSKEWMVEDATFTQSASVTGPALTFSVISVKGGGLNVSCSWQVGVVEDELAEGVSEDVGMWLNGLGRDGVVEFM
ncbi:uncharacterized protein FIESC28_08142 [Fusarium coffeatum]|uniref:Alcohol acetyltransferase FCK4 n=1 Tax=Fusarium coffeatum TaxID=231269 RepID=A0A366R8N2_9HYPO|nr:uncharacterized protein FIESC28_08142 [Fusarium coffeatum]RBR13514.1 hypothetical protein FIESC28_08142 [Fusarium coffeatum]